MTATSISAKNKCASLSALSEAAIEEKLPAMQEALKNFIEASRRPRVFSNQVDVEAYLTALKRAPHLIEEESNPRLFIRRDNGDSVAAARRLLAYWDKRVKFFGSEKAFSPLRESMGPEEVRILQAGPVVRLPPNEAGQDVLCIDITRRSRGCGGETTMANRARSIFWVTSLFFSNPKSQTDGLVLLSPLTENSTMNIPGTVFFRDLFESVLPIKIDVVHIVCCPSPGSKGIFKNCLIPTYTRALTDWSESKRLETHIGKNPEDLIRKLGAVGLTEQSIPETIGGSWKYSCWTDFIDHEFSSTTEPSCLKETTRPGESAKSLPLKKRIFMVAETEAAKKTTKGPPDAAAPATLAGKETDSTTGIQMNKGVETSYPDGMSLKGMPLSALGIGLDQDCVGHHAEETACNLAKAMMTNLGRCTDHEFANKEEKDAFLKKRDAIYSKRKYYKKKLKIESLRSKKEDLLAENAVLQRENKRLEYLVSDAKRIEETVCCKKPSASLKSPPATATNEVAASNSMKPPSLQVRASPLVKPAAPAAPTAMSSVAESLRQRQSAMFAPTAALPPTKPADIAMAPSGVANSLRQHGLASSPDTGYACCEKGQSIERGQQERKLANQPAQMLHADGRSSPLGQPRQFHGSTSQENTASSLEEGYTGLEKGQSIELEQLQRKHGGQPSQAMTHPAVGESSVQVYSNRSLSSSTQDNSTSAVARNYGEVSNDVGGISNTAQTLSDLEILFRQNSAIAQASVPALHVPDRGLLPSLTVGTNNNAFLGQRAATGHLQDLLGLGASPPSYEVLALRGLERLSGYVPNSQSGYLYSGSSLSEKELLVLSLLQSQQQQAAGNQHPAFLTNHSIARSLTGTASSSAEEQQRLLLTFLQREGLAPGNARAPIIFGAAASPRSTAEEDFLPRFLNSRRDNFPFS